MSCVTTGKQSFQTDSLQQICEDIDTWLAVHQAARKCGHVGVMSYSQCRSCLLARYTCTVAVSYFRVFVTTRVFPPAMRLPPSRKNLWPFTHSLLFAFLCVVVSSASRNTRRFHERSAATRSVRVNGLLRDTFSRHCPVLGLVAVEAALRAIDARSNQDSPASRRLPWLGC